MAQSAVGSRVHVWNIINFSKPISTLENLSRLAAKPGVQSTLVLSKSDGSIIRSTGLLADSAAQEPSDPPIAVGDHSFGSDTALGTTPGNNAANGSTQEDENKGNNAPHVARMIFKFVTAANEFADEMEKGDHARLLRMRLRRQEIVIVPDPKFLLAVIHDAPQA
ncbi:MAG: hypothetical protein Q9174_003625 [Haloplaca sp. 1 TL-2023]